MPTISANRSTVALLLLCLLLALIVALEWLYPTNIANTEVVTVESALTEEPDFVESVYLPPQMDDLSEMLDRPLFYADRRMPVEPEAIVAPAIALAPMRLKLEGIAIAMDTRVAVLRDLGNNQLVQLTEGMSHDGWTLESLTADGAVFKRGTEIAEVPLEA